MNRAETGHREKQPRPAGIRKQGCRPLAHNFHTRMGELDVVVQEPDGTIVICEVKTRAEGLWPARQKRWTGPNSAA